MTAVGAANVSLRRLLSERGSYPIIAAAAASGELDHFPVRLFDHIGDVYRRVETAADDDRVAIAQLRLTALVHEERPESIPTLLESGDDVSDFVPTVVAVIDAFGRVWKVRTEDDLRAYVERNRTHLPSILLFELSHEGRPTAWMERAAAVGGLRDTFASWAARLSRLENHSG
jgi:hypothetical protein